MDRGALQKEEWKVFRTTAVELNPGYYLDPDYELRELHPVRRASWAWTHPSPTERYRM